MAILFIPPPPPRHNDRLVGVNTYKLSKVEKYIIYRFVYIHKRQGRIQHTTLWYSQCYPNLV